MNSAPPLRKAAGRGRRTESARSQALFGFADQAVSSATNFGVVVVAAVGLSSSEFGSFSVVLVLFGIVVAGSQAVVGQELVLHPREGGDLRDRCADALLFVGAIGLGVGVLLVCAALLMTSVRGPVLVLAVALPGLLIQDGIRFAASALAKMQIALACDLAWAAAAIPPLIAVSRVEDPKAWMYVAAWAGGGVLAALGFVGLFIKGTHPALARFMRRDYLGYRFVWEFLAVRACSQGLTVLLGAMAGIAATGAVRGATALFGPLGVAMMAIASFGVPVLRSVGPNKRDLALVALAGAMLAVSVCATVGLLLIPDAVGRDLLGDTWAAARSLVPAMGFQTAALAVSTVAFLALRLVEPTATLRLRLWTAAAVVAGFFTGYALDGTVGAVWGLATASGAQAALGVAAYLRRRANGSGVANVVFE